MRQLGVAGSVHHAHAALAEFLDDFVMKKFFADHHVMPEYTVWSCGRPRDCQRPWNVSY